MDVKSLDKINVAMAKCICNKTNRKICYAYIKEIKERVDKIEDRI